MDEELVTIIIPSANRKQFILPCLSSIKKNTKYKNYEVIVLDENSKDDSVQAIKSKFKWVKVIENKRVIGYGNLNNLGFLVGKSKYFMLLNNDTLVIDGWLENSLEKLKSDEKIATVQCTIITDDEYERGDFGLEPDKEKLSLSSCAMLVRKSVIDEIGNFDSNNFHPIYGDEVDWCYRARKFGYKLIRAGNAFVVHRHNPKKKKLRGERFELLYTHTFRAMFFNLSFFDLVKHIPGFGLILLNSVKDGFIPYFFKSLWNNLVDLNRIIYERVRRKHKEKIMGMDLEKLDYFLDNYKDIKAIRVRDGSIPELIV